MGTDNFALSREQNQVAVNMAVISPEQKCGRPNAGFLAYLIAMMKQGVLHRQQDVG